MHAGLNAHPALNRPANLPAWDVVRESGDGLVDEALKLRRQLADKGSPC